ncbi:MAG: hydrogenase expression/formation protein HypE [Candidatus Brocadiia bacterium]|jgi:hydrogenase expression/formation protein HypE
MSADHADEPRIMLAHGGGGVMMQELIGGLILRHLGNPTLNRLEDAAVLAPCSSRLAFTTDAFVVKPIFFRGGDIGRLAVCGAVNDLAAVGAEPLALSLSLVIEEGLPISVLDRVLQSVAATAAEARVQVVTGDTKVVERGAADGLFLITAGLGAVCDGVHLSPAEVRPGDAVIATGTLGDHGIAIISQRSGLEFESPVQSDVAPLGGLVEHLFAPRSPVRTPHSALRTAVHCMRDPTRGGTAAVLNEIAAAAKVEIEIEESLLPVRPEVAGACDMLGFDPLYVPNEGRLIIFCAEDAAASLVERLRSHPLAAGAVRIGSVKKGARACPEHSRRGRVVLRTRVGGTRIVAAPYGEQLPRIC